MAIFADLLNDDLRVQIKDRIRLSAEKSYTTTGGDDISTLTITPGADGSAISVFASREADRFTDYQWNSWTGDIWAGFNNKVDFTEDGSTELTATIPDGTYTLAALVAEVATQMTAAGSETYTASLDKDDKLTLSSTGNFQLYPEGTNEFSSLLPHIGYRRYGDDQQQFEIFSSSAKGREIEYMHKQITVTAGDGTLSDSHIDSVRLYSEKGDRLFSTDSMLSIHEHDIMKWLPDGLNSYKAYHRRSQDLIMEYIYKQGFTNIYRDPLTKFDLRQTRQVRDWSTFMTLAIIFNDISNQTDDVFRQKAGIYEKKSLKARSRFLKIDMDRDGDLEDDEYIRMHMGNLFVR
jgi:hypothetical protein